MKEATGEASMTGITIAVIAVVAVVAIPIVRNLLASVELKSCCSSLGGEWNGTTCTVTTSTGSNNLTKTELKTACS